VITEPGAVEDLRRACAIQAAKIRRTGRLNAKGRDITVFVLEACYVELSRRRLQARVTFGAMVIAGAETLIAAGAALWYFL